jgi:ankyrin repeat protein
MLSSSRNKNKDYTYLFKTIANKENGSLKVFNALSAEEFKKLPDIRNDQGDTLLHWAVQESRETFVDYLINTAKLNVNVKNKCGTTPLHLAASPSHKLQNLTIVQMLIKAGANIDELDNSNRSALHYAAGSDFSACVKLLVTEGAKVSLISKGTLDDGSALHLAAAHNNIESMQYLVGAKADVNSVNANGATPIHFATQYMREESIRWLVNHGASLNRIGECANGLKGTPLHMAVMKSDVKGIQLLKDLGANLDAVDNNLNTPLHIAVKNRDLACTKLLVKLGANVEAKNDKNYLPLLLLIFYNDEKDTKNENGVRILNEEQLALLDFLVDEAQASINFTVKSGNKRITLKEYANDLKALQISRKLAERELEIQSAKKNKEQAVSNSNTDVLQDLFAKVSALEAKNQVLVNTVSQLSEELSAVKKELDSLKNRTLQEQITERNNKGPGLFGQRP